MQKSLIIPVLLIVGIFAVVFGTLTSQKSTSGLRAEEPNFDAQLLREASKKYSDPNNISNIPDEVIIEDFINIAFSDHDWGGDYPWYHGQELEELYVGDNKWALGVINSSYEAPRNRINKFKGPAVRFKQDWWLINTDDLAERASNLSKDLSKITKLPFSLLPPSRSGVVGGDFEIYIDEAYPFSPPPSGPPSEVKPNPSFQAHLHPPYFVFALKNAVRFTPRLKAKVSGYFVKNSDGSIKHALCELFRTKAAFYPIPTLQDALLAECLIRSLGLPDHSLVFRNTTLGHWAYPYEKMVEQEHIREREREPDENELAQGFKIVGMEPRYQGVDPTIVHPMQYSAYDKLMVSILYDNRIAAGMSISEAREVLPQVLKDIRSQN